MAREPIIERLLQLDTCAVSDALDSLSLRGATWGVRPQWPCGKIAGRAVTMKIKPAGMEIRRQHLGTAPIEAAQAGDIIVIDNGGHSWPGKPQPAFEAQFGHTTTDIDATALLFQFFFDNPT